MRNTRWTHVGLVIGLVVILGPGCARPTSPAARRESEAEPKAEPKAEPYHGIELPRTTSFTEVQPSCEVRVHLEQITVRRPSDREAVPVARIDGGRIASSAKPDGPDSFLVAPLRQALERAGKDLRTRVAAIVMDARLPYRLLVEVLFTVNQAGFSTYQLVGRRVDGGAGAVIFSPPRSGPVQAGAPDPCQELNQVTEVKIAGMPQPEPSRITVEEVTPLALAVGITDKGLSLTSTRGPECPAGGRTRRSCFERSADGRFEPATLAALARHVHALHLQFDAPGKHLLPACDRHRVIVTPELGVKVADVMAVLDALRDVPRAALPAAQQERYPGQGCRLPFDAQAGHWGDATVLRERWGITKENAAACMFHRATLAVGPH
jgi:biopolymer transport protein ExbD